MNPRMSESESDALPLGDTPLSDLLLPPQVRFWLGWLDLNQRMRESKSRALPLGYTPLYLLVNLLALFPISSIVLVKDWSG